MSVLNTFTFYVLKYFFLTFYGYGHYVFFYVLDAFYARFNVFFYVLDPFFRKIFFQHFILFYLDLELSDFITSSPCLQTRTPGQLLSLTSHLTFGSGEPKSRNRSNLMHAINRQSKHFFLLFPKFS